jgi:hypothetical protein
MRFCPVGRALSERFMGELIELSYRHFHRHVIDRLVRRGYLPSSERHELAAVTRAWDRFRADIERIAPNDPKK